MTTLLTALFYLWLVITILLVAMWFLRRQDRLRHGDNDKSMTGGGPRPDGPPKAAAEPSPVAKTQPADNSEPAILQLLDGASLPFDLTPVTGRIAEPDRHVILLSPHGDAEAVGTAFADELTRLGYTIDPDGLDQAKASRGDDVLMLKISPDAGTRGSGAYRRYPTAGDTDVAIEIWTGRDSPPSLID